MFSAARQAAPCLLFIDDFDVLSARRGGVHGGSGEGGGGDSDVAGRVLSTFLNELDGVHQGAGEEVDEKDSRVIVVVAVPSLSSLDEALLRPGRLQLHIELPYLTLEETVTLLKRRLERIPGGENISAVEVAAALHARDGGGGGGRALRVPPLSCPLESTT